MSRLVNHLQTLSWCQSVVLEQCICFMIENFFSSWSKVMLDAWQDIYQTEFQCHLVINFGARVSSFFIGHRVHRKFPFPPFVVVEQHNLEWNNKQKKKRLNDFEHFNLYHQCSAVSVWNVWLKYKLQTLSWCWNSAFVLQCEFSSVNVQECSRCIARHLSKRWFENVLWTAFFNVPCLHLAIN